MDIYEVAKGLELEGKELYEAQAKKTDDEGLKNILLMLAQQEQEHFNIFDSLQKKRPLKIKRESFKGISEVFKDLRKDLPKDQVDFYKKVLDIEKKSEAFYEKIALEQESEEAKEVILRIAKEEHKHWVIVKNIIDYIKRPDQWVEDAEFHHLEDY